MQMWADAMPHSKIATVQLQFIFHTVIAIAQPYHCIASKFEQ